MTTFFLGYLCIGAILGVKLLKILISVLNDDLKDTEDEEESEE